MPRFTVVTRSRRFLRDLNAPRERRSFLSGRAGFIAITVGLHFVARSRA